MASSLTCGRCSPCVLCWRCGGWKNSTCRLRPNRWAEGPHGARDLDRGFGGLWLCRASWKAESSLRRGACGVFRSWYSEHWGWSLLLFIACEFVREGGELLRAGWQSPGLLSCSLLREKQLWEHLFENLPCSPTPPPTLEKGPHTRRPHHHANWGCRWDSLGQSLDWALCRGRELRGTESQGWNVINNDNEVFYLGDIHLHLFRPTERCPRVVKGNPLRAHISI